MNNLDNLVHQIREKQHGDKRLMVAIAGPPASGKSTLAQSLHEKIVDSIVVPMDGFHLDNEILDEMGERARKGAPHTFDGKGFVKLIQSIAEDEASVNVPEFDRSQDRVVEGTSRVLPQHRIILVEGNYLLLKDAPWDALSALFDFTIFVNPGIETLKARLIERWLNYDHSQEEAIARANSNDIPNAEWVLERSIAADLML